LQHGTKIYRTSGRFLDDFRAHWDSINVMVCEHLCLTHVHSTQMVILSELKHAPAWPLPRDSSFPTFQALIGKVLQGKVSVAHWQGYTTLVNETKAFSRKLLSAVECLDSLRQVIPISNVRMYSDYSHICCMAWLSRIVLSNLTRTVIGSGRTIYSFFSFLHR
jgi:hypothetical protein